MLVGARNNTNPVEVSQATSTISAGNKQQVESSKLSSRKYALEEFILELSDAGLASGFKMKFKDELGEFPAGEDVYIGTWYS